MAMSSSFLWRESWRQCRLRTGGKEQREFPAVKDEKPLPHELMGELVSFTIFSLVPFLPTQIVQPCTAKQVLCSPTLEVNTLSAAVLRYRAETKISQAGAYLTRGYPNKSSQHICVNHQSPWALCPAGKSVLAN